MTAQTVPAVRPADLAATDALALEPLGTAGAATLSVGDCVVVRQAEAVRQAGDGRTPLVGEHLAYVETCTPTCVLVRRLDAPAGDSPWHVNVEMVARSPWRGTGLPSAEVWETPTEYAVADVVKVTTGGFADVAEGSVGTVETSRNGSAESYRGGTYSVRVPLTSGDPYGVRTFYADEILGRRPGSPSLPEAVVETVSPSEVAPEDADAVRLAVAGVWEAYASRGRAAAEEALSAMLGSLRRDVRDADARRETSAREIREQAETRHREIVARLYADHDEDLRTIGAALAETAERREWCDEYEQQIDGVVGSLNRPEAFEETARRDREWSVDVPVVAYVTMTVRARDEDGAAEEAASMWRDYVDADSLRYNVERDTTREPIVEEA